MERLIVVVGQARVGKSSFICDLVPDSTKVGQGPQRETDKAQSVVWTSDDRIKVILVDTPGFDDARETDEDNLETIATYLKTEHRSQTPQLCGLVYVHMSTDIQVEAASRCIGMFEESYGLHSMKNVAIITTMWDKVTSQTEQREKELEALFKPLLEDGAVIMRHDRSCESASAIINHLLKEHTTPQTAHGHNIPPDETAEAEKNKPPIKVGDDKSANRNKTPSAADKDPANELPGVGMKGYRKRNETGNFPRVQEKRISGKTGPEKVKRVARHSVSVLSKPDSSCVMDCVELLRFISLSKATLGSSHNTVSQHIVLRIFKFGESLETDAKHMEQQRETCELILDSKSLPELRRFLKELGFSLLKTRRLWLDAQNHTRIGISDIKAHLDAPQNGGFFEWLFRNRQTKRNGALTRNMDLLVNIADGMQTVREWWAPIFNTMEKLRDEVSCATGEFILENDMTSLRYICTAMDLYYSEYGACVKEMLQVYGDSDKLRQAYGTKSL